LIFRVALLLVAAASCGGDGRTADNLPADSVGIAIRDPGLWPVMTFVPTGTEIDSLPLALIDSSWSLATPLDVSMLPQHDSTGVFGVSDSVGFRFEGDFNHDGIPDRARVGVYHDAQGDEGSFVLILTRSSLGTAAKVRQALAVGAARVGRDASRIAVVARRIGPELRERERASVSRPRGRRMPRAHEIGITTIDWRDEHARPGAASGERKPIAVRRPRRLIRTARFGQRDLARRR